MFKIKPTYWAPEGDGLSATAGSAGIVDPNAGTAGTGGDQGSTGGSAAASTGGGETFTSSAGSSGTVSTTGGSTGVSARSTATGAWPDDWRDRAAKGDSKSATRLARYASPEAALEALLQFRTKMDSGELRSTLKKDASEAEVKAWRAEQGIPETAEGYELKLADGLVVGEEDKPIIDTFLQGLHGAGMNNAQASAAVNWYYSFQETQAEQQAVKDAGSARAAEDTLREEWGKDYRPNMNMMHSLLDMAPPGLKDKIMHGRLSDGTAIGSSPDAIRWFTGMSRELNPAGALVAGSGAGQADSIEVEIGTIEKRMREDRPGYNKDDKQQARYRELIDARDNLKKRAA